MDGAVVSWAWACKKHTGVSLSTIEVSQEGRELLGKNELFGELDMMIA